MEISLSNYSKIEKIVLENFALREESQKRFSSLLNTGFTSDFYKEYLSGATRKKIPIKADMYEIIDAGWVKFKVEFKSFYERTNISYADFSSGNYKDKKLLRCIKEFYVNNKELCTDFSYLAKAGIREKEIIEHNISCRYQNISLLRLPKNKNLFVCLSVDFADWFLSSTGESWTSCIDLESDFPNCFWAGLPGLVADKNRCLIYLGDEDLEPKDYFGIKVDHIINRTWCLLDNFDTLFIVKNYPFLMFNENNLSQLFGLKFKDMNEEFKTKYDIEPLFNVDNKTCFIYLDRSTFKYEGSNPFKISITGTDNRGGFITLDEETSVTFDDTEFFHTEGLSSLIEKRESLSNKIEKTDSCIYCGEVFAIEDLINHEGDLYCNSCFTEQYFSCEKCGKVLPQEDGEIFESGEVSLLVCEKCFDTLQKRVDKK